MFTSTPTTAFRYESERYVVIIKLITPKTFLILFLIYLYFLSFILVKFLVFSFLFSLLSTWSVIVPPFQLFLTILLLKLNSTLDW